MTHTKINTKTTKGKHLTSDERDTIHHLKVKEGLSNRAIARKLGRCPQTINNEIKRGNVPQIRKQTQNGKTYTYSKKVYCPDAAKMKYEENRKSCGRPLKWIKQPEVLDELDRLMSKSCQFSPDIAVFCIKVEGSFSDDVIPCTSTLYNWIDKGYLQTKNIDLLYKVSQNTKKKKVQKNRKVLGDSIEKRPDIVDNREEFGHWEIDTVIGCKSDDEPVLLTITERKTRFELILPINGKTSVAVTHSLDRFRGQLGEHFSSLFKTITADNGAEFAGLTEQMNDLEETNVYFTHPYSSWERGTNENHNRMIRRFIPKGNKMSLYSVSFIKQIQQWMNDLPRKIIGYKTPHQAFVKELHKLDLPLLAI